MRAQAVRWILTALLVSACASVVTSREYVDEDTAAAITVAGAPFVFARERTDLAVHAQDYVTVTPVQVNRGGQRLLFLYCQIWSTIDRRADKAILPNQPTLALIADDRRIELPKDRSDIRRLGFGHEPVASIKNAEVRVAPIDVELLRFMSKATQLRIAVSLDGGSEYFVPWRDGRKSAEEFLRHVEVSSR